MAPTRLQTHTTHRKMRKASRQPGIGHFPGSAVASSLSADTQEHPLRFCENTGTDQNTTKLKLCSHINRMWGLGGPENINIEALTELLSPQILKRKLMVINTLQQIPS